MSYEAYQGYRLAPDDNGCVDVLTGDYEQIATYPSKAAAKRAVDEFVAEELQSQAEVNDLAKSHFKATGDFANPPLLAPTNTDEPELDDILDEVTGTYGSSSVEVYEKKVRAKSALARLIALKQREQAIRLKSDWDKWLAFDDDDPAESVLFKDIIAWLEYEIAELNRIIGDSDE